jgi:hypothetical protein
MEPAYYATPAPMLPRLHPLVDPRGSFGGRGGTAPCPVPLLPSVGEGQGMGADR